MSSPNEDREPRFKGEVPLPAVSAGQSSAVRFNGDADPTLFDPVAHHRQTPERCLVYRRLQV
jgi:hypothetical protein